MIDYKSLLSVILIYFVAVTLKAHAEHNIRAHTDKQGTIATAWLVLST